MKRILIAGILSFVLSVISCKKDDPVNLNNPNLASPLNCSAGYVITSQGTFPQGSCPYGQGQNPANNQCVAGTPCQGNVGAVSGVVSYHNSLNIVSRSMLENLMADVYGVCFKNNAWGSANCDHYSHHLEIIIETMGPVAGVLTPGLNNAFVTLYVGVERIPLVNPVTYWPINNNVGFELRSIASAFRVVVENGQLGQDSLMIRVLYNNAEFANGMVSRFR